MQIQKKNIIRLTVGPILTNCWIYPLGESNNDGSANAAIVDPGGDADKIISALKKESLAPGYILLTHGHFDHIAALTSVVKAFPSCRPEIAIHALDAGYLGPDSYAVHCESIKAAAGDISLIDNFWDSPPPASCLLEDGSIAGPFTVLHVPGHTQGSIALWDKEAGNLFTGDTLFKGAYGRTDLPGGNEKQIFPSLRRLFTLDGAINVFPGHGHTTTIASEADRLANRLAARTSADS